MYILSLQLLKELKKLLPMNILPWVSVHLLFALGLVRDVSGQFHLQRERRNGSYVSPRSVIASNACSISSSQSGSCIPLIRCRAFWSRGNMPNLTNSSCGKKIGTKVCCPMLDDTETTISVDIATVHSTLVNSTRPLASIHPHNANDTGRRRRLDGFPQNCGRSGAIFQRIIGGQPSILGAWPWMAVVYFVRRGVKSPECGGTLITNSHVLTAAHCTVTVRRGTTLNPRQLLVRLGELNIDSDNDGASPLDINIRSIIKHERFDMLTFQNDLSILELVKPVETSNRISPICLPFNIFTTNDDLVDRNAIVIGWGSTRFEGPGSSSLQEVSLRIWNNDDCQKIFRRDVPITQVNICAGDGDKDACTGDSGGPLMLPDSSGRFHIVGIVSFGRRCAEPGIPGVYTRVPAFLDWIEEKIG